MLVSLELLLVVLELEVDGEEDVVVLSEAEVVESPPFPPFPVLEAPFEVDVED